MQSLVDEVLLTCHKPRDKYEITALLEAMGWTDEKVQDKYGLDDCFALGNEIFNIIVLNEVPTQFQATQSLSERDSWWQEFRYFLRGLMFAMPMIISIISVLLLRFSLWSYMDFSVELATAIALGTILSFLTTGGFTQAVARRGLIYMVQDEYGLARRISTRILGVGFIVVLIVGLLVFLTNLIFNLFPARTTSIILIYYFFLSIIWLSITVLYMLQEEILFNVVILAGIGIIYLLKVIFSINILVAQPIALFFAAILSVIIAFVRFRNKEKSSTADELDPPLPRASLVVYSVIEYFIYGFFYFMILNIDRVVAWSANQSYMPYPIWFRGEYELGMDFALFGLILPMGLVELFINRYSNWLLLYQTTTPVTESYEIADTVRRRFLKERIVIALWSAGSLIILFLFYRFILQLGILPDQLKFNEVTNIVFLFAAPGYVLLSIALLNCMYLFCLSYPEPINRAISWAVLVNVVLGFILSRTIVYYFAVIGFVVGTLIFAIITTIEVDRTFKKIDYIYYRSV